MLRPQITHLKLLVFSDYFNFALFFQHRIVFYVRHARKTENLVSEI